MAQITIPARIQYLGDLLDFLSAQMDAAGIGAAQKHAIAIVAEEVFVNISSYAYVPVEGDAIVRMDIGADSIALEFSDGGRQYDPLSHEDPDTTITIEERDIGGLGILIVKKMMDQVEYRYEGGRNVLSLIKARR